MRKFPELTFIPLEYANSKKANLTILTKDSKRTYPTIKEPFFVLWIPLNLNEKKLSESIQKTINDFPVEKALTCFINLAYPIQFIENQTMENISINHKGMIFGSTIAKIIPLDKIFDILTDIALVSRGSLSQLECSYSMYFWSLITKLGIQLIGTGSYLPQIRRVDSKNSDEAFFQDVIGRMKSKWIPILKTQKDIQNFKNALDYAPLSAYCISPPNAIESISISDLPGDLNEFFLQESDSFISSSTYSPSVLARSYIEILVDHLVRKSIKLKISLDSKPSWELRVLNSLLSKSSIFDIYEVKEEIIPQIFELWAQKLNLSWDLGYTLKLELLDPKLEEDNEDWMLYFSLHSLSDKIPDFSLDYFWGIIKDFNTKELSNQFPNFIALREYILKSLNILSTFYLPFATVLKEKYPAKLKLTSQDVLVLLQSAMKVLQSFGYNVELPDTFSLGGSQRIQPVLTVHSSYEEMAPESQNAIINTTFDIFSVLQYEWVLKIGDTILSEAERRQLFESVKDQSLLFWKDQWIMVDTQGVKQFQSNKDMVTGTISVDQALKLALTQNAYIQSEENANSGPYPVQFFGPLNKILDILRGNTDIPHLPQPEGFSGKLRRYQEFGYNWMRILTSIGFGCILADDMGLGKTIQVIALILSILENQVSDKNFLVICPTSVLGNWMRELAKFAPDIRAKLHYGPQRAKNIDELYHLLPKYDVILTSYNILRRDIGLLEVIKWESVILDESQNIKNNSTKQAKAAFRLVDNSRRRIALSGTPIENRITELWSLYHFINPFLLGPRSRFLKKYAVPVGKLGNEHLTKELRDLVNPFLLRRMKTNKKIIPELPDKQETEVYITLTEEQKLHYRSVVNMMLKELEALEENPNVQFQQKGLVLKALMQLKQICNHPDQFLHTKLEEVKKMKIKDFIKKSGKLQRCIELLEEAISSNDKILLFTQFKVMGDFLKYIIEEEFNLQVPFIHGGVPQDKRTKIVQQFQDDDSYQIPILMLSLRAGGVGLNLSNASIVIHFDRWWNPAVEDQATDRAYRIGQKNKVFVYKMVSEGTIEERISKMLEEKRNLAESIIETTGEEWITKLSFGELQEMFQLQEEE